MASSPSRYERTRCIRRGWAFERVGWALMGVVMLGAAAGFFGGGLFTGREATVGDDLTVRYPRFARAHAPFDLAIDWLPRREDASLWISRAILDGVEIAEIRPTPSAVSAAHDRIYYTFRLEKPSDRVGVTFRLKPEQGGELRGRIGSGEDLDIEVRQFAFP